MINQRFFLILALIFLPVACTQQSIKPSSTVQKIPPQINLPKNLPSEPLASKKKPIPIDKTRPSEYISVLLEENKSRPVVLSAAVQSLMGDAKKNMEAGDLDSASVILERALRISPQNPELNYQLSVLRLKQSQPRLAEDLAAKALFLAVDDLDLKKRCWLLIAQARELQGNTSGASEAQLKANHLE